MSYRWDINPGRGAKKISKSAVKGKNSVRVRAAVPFLSRANYVLAQRGTRSEIKAPRRECRWDFVLKGKRRYNW